MPPKNGKKVEVKAPALPNFTLEPNALRNALARCANAVDDKPQIPVLANIRLKVSSETRTVELAATNLSMTIITSVPCETEDDWSVTLPAKTFLPLVKSLNPIAEAEFSFDGSAQKVFIKQGRSKFEVRGISAEQFPALEDISEERTFSINAEKFCTALRSTMYAASSDPTVQMLTGVSFYFQEHTLKMMATDRYRGAWTELEVAEPFEKTPVISIPARWLREIDRIFSDDEGDLQVVLGKTPRQAERIIFSANGTEVQVMLLSEVYDQLPKYEEYILDLPIKAEVHLSTLKTVLERSMIFAQHNNNLCVLEFGEEGIRITGKSAELGESDELVEAEMSEDAALVIGEHVRFLSEALDVFEDAKFVEIAGKSKDWMLHITSVDLPGVHAITSPMQITQAKVVSETHQESEPEEA